LVELDLAPTLSHDQRVLGPKVPSYPLGESLSAPIVHCHDLVEGGGQGLSGPRPEALGGEPAVVTEGEDDRQSRRLHARPF
jgi:hypothetical protein